MKNAIVTIIAIIISQNLIAQIDSPDIQKIVAENTDFDKIDSIAKVANYRPGTKLKVFTKFSFNEDGKINILLCYGPSRILEQEAIKILNKIPPIEPPENYKSDSAEPVTFGWPIVFVVETQQQIKARKRKEHREAKRKQKELQRNLEEESKKD